MTWKPDICVYHGGCDDGFGAAFAVWQRWGQSVTYIPAGYGSPIDWLGSLEGKNLLIVDFSLKREPMRNLINGFNDEGAPDSIVVLDHHKTAADELAPYIVSDIPLFDLLVRLPDVMKERGDRPVRQAVAVFDMEKSGARMAWEFCVGPDVPSFIAHIEDRDLWRFSLEGTREFSAALRTYQQNFDEWSTLTTAALIAEGTSILRGHNKNVREFCRHAYEMEIGGYTVPVVNVPYHYASDTANELLNLYPKAPFAACWFQVGADKRQFSLRSDDTRVDVSEVAKAKGGGGHRNAAGFQEIAR